MADNVTLNTGTGGDVIAADDVAGVKYQIVKLAVGALDSASLVSNAAPIPVSDAGGTLSIDDGAGSITVDGTVAVSGTVTTSGNQVVTNAGTFAVQESGAALTALQLIDNIVLAEDAAHSSGDPGVLALGVRRDADTTPVSADGDYHALQFDNAGNLKVNIKAGAGSGGTAAADGATFTRGTTSQTPVGGVVETSAPTLTNGQAKAISLTTGGAVRVDVSSGSITGRAEDAAAVGGEDGIPVLAVRRDAASSGVSADGDWANLSVDSNGALRVTGGGGGTQYAEDAAHVSGDTGTLALVVRQDTLASSTSADGDYGAMKLNNVGRLYVTSTVDTALPTGTNTIGSVRLATGTTGGLSTYHLVSAGTTNATNVKASAGQLYGWYIYNSNAAARKVAFHNTAGTPTAGASVFFSLVIPPGSGANVFSDLGIAFSTGIGITTVTDLGDSGTTVVGAGDLIVNLWYA
jgi:hypothetical protein